MYAHFPSHGALLEAVVARTVRRATATLEAAEPDPGAPADALERIVAAGCSGLERHEAIARAAPEEIAADVRQRAHETVFLPVHSLVERGQREGAFRTDLPSTGSSQHYSHSSTRRRTRCAPSDSTRPSPKHP